jgi:hypothetical protein
MSSDLIHHATFFQQEKWLQISHFKVLIPIVILFFFLFVERIDVTIPTHSQLMFQSTMNAFL